MQHHNGLNIEQLSLESVCQFLYKTNPELANIISEWDPPGDKFKLYKIKYFYGKKILSHGKLQLPLLDGTTVAYDDVITPLSLVQDLSYSSFPIGIILTNTAEVFVELDSKIISLAVFDQGIPLGLLETLENTKSFCFRNVWTVTAGSRTAFMTPKISDKSLHAKIQREFGCDSPPPRIPSEQFDVFVEIMQRAGDQKNWSVDILFFGSEWFKKDEANIHWLKFHHYLQSYLLEYSGFSRNKPTFDLIWHYFLQALSQKKKRVNASVFEMMKNLITTAIGVSPAFSPAHDNSRAPIDKIQKVYREVYGLQYVPTMMVPRHFGFDKMSLPVYFSLKQQNMFELNPKNKESESLITDLVQLQSLLKDFLDMVENGRLKLENTIIESMIKATNFDFYHINSNEYRNIKNTKELPKTDALLVAQVGGVNHFDFAYTSSFFRSCVQIHKKKNIDINKSTSVVN